MIRLPAPALLSLAVVLASAAPAARAAESYDGCIGAIATLPAVLTSQGTYCLKKNLATNMSSGAAITIANSNVTLDCNDFRIQGSSAGPGTEAIGILVVNHLNFRLRNCVIRGFKRGASIYGTSSGHEIVDNRFEGNTETAIFIYSAGSTVRGNTIIDSGGRSTEGSTSGIYAAGDNDVIDNTVDGVMPATAGTPLGSYGIISTNSATSVVQGNRVRSVDGGGSSSYGIATYSGTFTTIEDNDVSIGSGDGMFGIFCSNPAIVVDNRIFGFSTALQGCADDGGNIDKP